MTLKDILLKIKNVFIKSYDWMKESNRWLHVLISIVIGVAITGFMNTCITAITLGCALEYKDKCYEGKWDWIDLSLTIIPALVANIIKMMV